MFVHTAHGPGRVIDEQSVRGRKSFLVEGRGFQVWLDEKDLRVANDVNDSNSTTLPYDPTPQHPTDMFNNESTMQPINEIDADEILSPSDSLSFEDESLDYPGPSADNFAKQGGFDGGHDSGYLHMPPQGYRGKHRPPPAPEMILDNGEGVWDSQDWMDAHPAQQFEDPREQARFEEWQNRNLGDQQFGDRALHSYEPIYANRLAETIHDHMDPDELWNENAEEPESIKHFSNRFAGAGEGLLQFAEDQVEDAVEDAFDQSQQKQRNPKQIVNEDGPKGKGSGVIGEVEHLADEFAGDQTHKEVGGWWPGRPDGQTITSSLYERPAGLSDKYIRVEAHVDHYSDSVQQFRDDPAGFINKRGYMMSDSLDIRLAEYIDLVDADHTIRTSAWRDVRTKALRLRREGRVHVKDLAADRIYASVQGDSDTYETMILKGAGQDQSISDWHCSCPWGRWAFKRQMSYVGRLCSHGYASYLEMESQQMKANNKRRRKSAAKYPHPGDEQDVGWDLDKYYRGIPDNVSEEDESPHHPGHWGQHHSRLAGIVEDFKSWAENENSGKVDQNAIDNFIYFLNSQQDGDRTVVSQEDAEKLYDALDELKATGKARNYDVDYMPDPNKAYKTADILHLRPTTLTPDYTFVEDGEGQWWDDVTKDERKTTGPDNMVKKSRRFVGRELHYASDEELGEAVKDWAGTGSDLEKLRGLSAEGPDLQNMRDRNDEIREVIDELHDRGIDASQFVASLRFAADAEADATASDDDKNKTQQIPDSQQGQPSMAGVPSQTGVPGGSSSVPGAKPNTTTSTPTPANSAGGSGDLSGMTKNPAAVGFNGSPAAAQTQFERPPGFGPNAGGGLGGGQRGIDPSTLMSGIGGAINAIPSIMQAIPSVANSIGQLGTGIGTGLGNLAQGLSSLRRGSTEHIAVPVGGFPNVQLTNQESFQGSGPNPKYWMGSSESYVDDHERDRFVDVTDLDDDPIIKYTDENPGQGPKKTSGSRRPFVASEDEVYNDLLQAKGDEIEAQGLYSQFVDDAQEAGNPEAASVIQEALDDERDHEHNFEMLLDHYASENQNPEGATLTSGPDENESGVANLDQVFKAGGYSSDKPWDGKRVRDFRRYVKQNGGNKPTHQMLQEYLSKPHRNLDQGGTQHLQEFTSYAEQHENYGPRNASRYAAEGEGLAELGSADVPGITDDVVPLEDDLVPFAGGLAGDGSDIVANFHRMGGIEAINNSGGRGGGSYSDSAIADQARGFLRTAGRMYSLAEQRALEEESHPKGARNLNELNLEGTHYEDAL